MTNDPITCALRFSSCSTSRSRSPCPSSICRLRLSNRPWSRFRAASFSSNLLCASSNFLVSSFFSFSARENCWRNCSALRVDEKRYVSVQPWHTTTWATGPQVRGPSVEFEVTVVGKCLSLTAENPVTESKHLTQVNTHSRAALQRAVVTSFKETLWKSLSFLQLLQGLPFYRSDSSWECSNFWAACVTDWVNIFLK